MQIREEVLEKEMRSRKGALVGLLLVWVARLAGLV